MDSGTVVAPASSTKIHKIECSGRTQRKLPLPQRMDFGQGKLRIVVSNTSAMISAAWRPGFSSTANRVTPPFLSSRRSN